MCLQQLGSNNGPFIEAALRKAEFGRTNNFDLIQDDGYSFLRTELVADFPYLTLTELSEIITLGIKGKLDVYRQRPLNFTRIYQWVEQEAPKTLTYWRNEMPDLMDWADRIDLTAELLLIIRKSNSPELLRQLLVGKVAQLTKIIHWPTINPLYTPDSQVDNEITRVEWAAHRRITKELWPAFVATRPRFAINYSDLLQRF